MSGGGRRRGVTEDEHRLWGSVARTVAPLRRRRVESKPVAAPEVPGKRAAVARPSPQPVVVAAKAPAPAPGALGRKLKQRVARGREPIDGRLDLHGMTQSEAHAALLRFLRHAAAKGARLVLVITGKGGSTGERGVLRRQVPHWLALPEFRDLVIGFESAHAAHGGEGALYVRVRRER